MSKYCCCAYFFNFNNYEGEIMKRISIFKDHKALFQVKPSEKSQKGQGMTEYLAATA